MKNETIKRVIEMTKENWEHCKHIAEELDAYASGNVYRDENDNYYSLEEAEADGIDLDDLEPCSMYDYFEDVLDFNFITDCRKEYKAVRVLVAFGGPNIYINTLSGNVELYWWTDYADYPLSLKAIEAIDDYFHEYFYM